MKIDRISVSGFKSIQSTDVTLENLNVLIGANGSGKSNFIGVFHFIDEILSGNLQITVQKGGGAHEFLHFGPKITQSIDISVLFGKNGYSCRLVPTKSDTLVFERENTEFYGNGPEKIPFIDMPESGHAESTLARYADDPSHHVSAIVFRVLKSWKIYHFHDTGDSSPIKQTNQINDTAYFRKDGSNLAAYLYLLKKKYPAHYRQIRDTVRLVAPFFDDFSLRPDEYNPETIRLEWTETGSDYPFLAGSLSDGTLRFMCLATLLQQPDLPDSIIIDEPELGLHPYAIAVLAGLIRSAATRTQVILSTQSVTLVNQFEPKDLLIVDRIDGKTCIQRPDEEMLSEWMEDYSIGELWEKNILGGRPS